MLLEKISAKLLRSTLKNTAHKNYISQSFFRHMEKESFSKGHSITFIDSSKLSLDITLTNLNSETRYVIAGGSDFDTVEIPRITEQYEGIEFFIQNLCVPETPRVKLLPIGIEDLSWGKSGLSINFRKSLVKRIKQRKILVGPFGNTHPSRREMMGLVVESANLSILKKRIPHWKYSRIASEYLYIACPRGNGIDTHRFWETLYRGGIPIVVRSSWSDNLRAYNLPFVEVSNWSELNNMYLPPADHWSNFSLDFISTKWWSNRLS